MLPDTPCSGDVSIVQGTWGVCVRREADSINDSPLHVKCQWELIRAFKYSDQGLKLRNTQKVRQRRVAGDSGNRAIGTSEFPLEVRKAKSHVKDPRCATWRSCPKSDVLVLASKRFYATLKQVKTQLEDR